MNLPYTSANPRAAFQLNGPPMKGRRKPEKVWRGLSLKRALAGMSVHEEECGDC